MSTQFEWNPATPAEAVGQVGCTRLVNELTTTVPPAQWRPAPCPTCGRCPTCQPWQQFPSYPYRPFEVTGVSVPAIDSYTMVMN